MAPVTRPQMFEHEESGRIFLEVDVIFYEVIVEDVEKVESYDSHATMHVHEC
eukprot:SAG11_NODE_1043_length_6052_cov_7.005711_2_plen_52_part_00